MAEATETKRSLFSALAAMGRDKSRSAMLLLGLGAGLPYAVLTGTLNAWFTEENVDVSTIGVLSLGGVFLTQSASAVLLGLFPEPGATASSLGYSVLFASVGVIGLGVSLICRRIPRAD